MCALFGVLHFTILKSYKVDLGGVHGSVLLLTPPVTPDRNILLFLAWRVLHMLFPLSGTVFSLSLSFFPLPRVVSFQDFQMSLPSTPPQTLPQSRGP